MQRYFAFLDNNKNIVFNKDDIFHMSHVMRMKSGEEIEANVDGDIYVLSVLSFEPFKYEIKEKRNENHELNGYIRLLYCLPKGEKVDLVIQKCVELGVSEVVLINSTRSVAKITKDKKENKLIRFHKIIKEASEQSKRTKLMKLDDVIDYKEIKNYQGDINLIAYENTSKTLQDLSKILANSASKTINIIVGAEGGLTKEEVELALKLGYQEISLGKRILRSETACIYIVSLLSFYLDM